MTTCSTTGSGWWTRVLIPKRRAWKPSPPPSTSIQDSIPSSPTTTPAPPSAPCGARRGDHRRRQDPIRSALDHHLDETGRNTLLPRPAVARQVEAHHLERNARLPGLGFGHTDAAQLGIGEDRIGHYAAGGART